MANPKISIIAAIGKNTRALGLGDELIWRISEDLKRFKTLTMGHPIIMGRKTYESIGRALPGRLNIVITRNKSFVAEGCAVVNSLKEALEKANEVEKDEIFVIGGSEIFKDILSKTDRLYLTLVDSEEAGDVYFPEYENEFSKVIEQKESSEGDLKYTYLTLER